MCTAVLLRRLAGAQAVANKSPEDVAHALQTLNICARRPVI